MEEIARIIVYTGLAGACIPLGGYLATFERVIPSWLETEFRHFIIAFGGGVLLAAVALVLVPEGSHYLSHPVWSVVTLLAGGVLFMVAERAMAGHHSRKPQLLAMLLDYLPESMALGGALALGSNTALLLAVFIGLQNIPEGFNAYRELQQGRRMSRSWLVGLMVFIVLLGPVIGIVGWHYLSQHTAILGAIMLFASGGILYLIFQDIAPQSKMRRHWAPPLGAVIGFSLGMLGQKLIGN